MKQDPKFEFVNTLLNELIVEVGKSKKAQEAVAKAKAKFIVHMKTLNKKPKGK